MIGRTISEYTILEKLGEGGMGVVYKAEDIKLKHNVALKFLTQELISDADAKERFLREAQAAFSLDHPNVCTVHGIGETDEEKMFIVMAYYQGETLKKKIERGPLDIKESRDIVVQVAKGLANAHRHSIIHRDIKPANIMITRDGVVKILDFGLAHLGDQSKMSGGSSSVGTVAYMSPEQTRGEKIDHRTDLWSLGAVLYEMLTGKPPFQGEFEQVILYSVLNVDPEDPKKIRNDIPDDLLNVCLRCLAKDKNGRPQSADDLLELLGEELPHPVPKFSIRNMAIAISLGLAILFGRQYVCNPPIDASRGNIIAVLPFRNQTGEEAVSGWLPALQSVIANELMHMGITPFDPQSMNKYLESSVGSVDARPSQDMLNTCRERGIAYLLDGNILKKSPGYTVDMELQDLTSNEIVHTDAVYFTNFDSLSLAVQELVPQVNELLHLKQVVPQKDLTPWVSGRRQNMRANKAFMEAADYIYRGDLGGEKYLRRAIEIDSMFVTPRVWLVSSLATKGQIDEATIHHDFLSRHEKDANPFEQAMIEWCGAYIQDDLAAQSASLRTAITYSPGNNILLFNLARLEFIDNDWQGMADFIKPAVDMKWQYSPAHYILGISYVRLNRSNEAREVLEKSLVITPGVYAPVYALLSALAYQAHDTSTAILNEKKFIKRKQEVGDSLPAIYSSLGGELSDEGIWGRAATYYRMAINLRPSVTKYHDSLAILSLRLGDLETAEGEAGKLRKLDPKKGGHYYYTARIFETRKDTPHALQNYQECLRIDSLNARGEEIKQRMKALRQ